MIDAQERILAEGRGLIIFLQQEGRGHGAAAHVSTLELKQSGILQDDAYKLRGFHEDIRRYDIAAKIIKYLGINSIILMSSSRMKRESLEGLGIVIKEMQGHSHLVILEKGLSNLEYYVKQGRAEPLWKSRLKRIFIIGDLMVDYNYTVSIQRIVAGSIIDKPSPVVGGTAFNAAKALQEKKFEPIVFGKVGNDNEGRLIIKALKDNSINVLIAVSDEKPTGSCHLIYLESMPRTIIQETNNANDYDIPNLIKALNLTKIESGDIIFLVGHPFVRFRLGHTKRLIDTIAETGAKIILDIVPHNMYEKVKFEDFESTVAGKVQVIIAEYKALNRFVRYSAIDEAPSLNDIEAVVTRFNSQIRSKVLIVRYGEGNIEKQVIFRFDADKNSLTVLEPEQDTGYSSTSIADRRGFGDKLTADLLSKYYDEL
jgi:sugar/nucleoside kinase (ribokinase family)